jgi:IS30 family transposase
MCFKQLSEKDRFYIEKRRENRASCYLIAKELGRSPSTIRREIERNTDPEFKGLYSSRRAHTLASERRTVSSASKAFRWIAPEVMDVIHGRLKLHTSPEIISGELSVRQGIQVSKNTIYRYLDNDRRSGGTLYRLLPHRGKPYRPRGKGRAINIQNRVGIEHRPPIADKKQEPGHFEVDTIFGKDQKSFLLTLTDKATKSEIIRKLPNKEAETVFAAFREIMSSTLYTFKTLTSDNGTEFAWHEKIAEITGAQFFFARPYHSWERGLNEHTNGQIRRFYPKGTDFNQVSDEEIAALEHTLNTRGRKSLAFKSPNEVMLAHLIAG